MDEFEEGITEWFGSNGQSYGYIKRPDGGQVYVHYKHLKQTGQRDSKFMELRKGDVVKYKVVDGFRNEGTMATDVEIVRFAEDGESEGK